MKNIHIDFTSKAGVQSTIDAIKNYLHNHSVCINQSYYLITEFEFYVETKSNVHADKFTYSDDRQATTGQLFLHASGLDITFGNELAFAGVLLRGAIKLDTIEKPTEADILKYINGPINLADELVHQINVLNGTTIEFKPIDTDRLNITYLQGQRIGLKKNKVPIDSEKFITKNLRYLSVLDSEVMKMIDPEKKVKIRKIVQVDDAY